MKKLKIISAAIFAISSFSISAQANEEIISTAFYNFQEDFSIDQIYDNNIEFEKEGLCNYEGAFYKIVQKYDDKNKMGELYKCVDSKWVYQNNITNKKYQTEFTIIKKQKAFGDIETEISYQTDLFEGDVNFSFAQNKQDYISSYNYNIDNDGIKETIHTKELKTGTYQFLHLYKTKNNNIKIYAKILINYVDENNSDLMQKIEPTNNIKYEKTFNLKDYKNNKIKDTISIYGQTFDIQIKIQE